MTPDELPALLRSTVEALEGGHARTESLARLTERRRILGLGGGQVFEPLGRVWRLGVLLLGADGTLYAAGAVTRAAEERQHGWTAVSAAERSAIRALAARSFPVGETVNYDAAILVPNPGGGVEAPLHLIDGDVRVEWAPKQHPTAIAAYLRERTELLISPPGA